VTAERYEWRIKMMTETLDTLTSLNIPVLASQKSYLEQRAALEGLAEPDDYLRQLIRADQRRKAQDELEQLLVKAIESDNWIEGTPEYWAQKKAELAAKYQTQAKS
jgi:antitoxin ParD1/3/4